MRPKTVKTGTRLLRIGPGLLVAIFASILVWAWMPRPGKEPPKVVSVPSPTGPPSAPEPAWLLEQKDSLRLTPDQVDKLEQRKERWDRDTKDLRAELDAATAAFQRGMTESGGTVALRDIQEQAAPVSELSRRLADARRAWWSDTSSVLTADQKTQAEKAWAERLQSRPSDRKETP